MLEKIKQACKDHGTSIPKLEEELGIGRNSMYNWDESCPSAATLKRVCDRLELDMGELLEEGTDQNG